MKYDHHNRRKKIPSYSVSGTIRALLSDEFEFISSYQLVIPWRGMIGWGGWNPKGNSKETQSQKLKLVQTGWYSRSSIRKTSNIEKLIKNHIMCIFIGSNLAWLCLQINIIISCRISITSHFTYSRVRSYLQNRRIR